MRFGETLARFRRTPDQITMYRLVDAEGDTASDYMAWDGTDWYADLADAAAAKARLDGDYGPLRIQTTTAPIEWVDV